MATGVGGGVPGAGGHVLPAAGGCSAAIRSPKYLTKSDQLVTSLTSLAAAAGLTVTATKFPGCPLTGPGSCTLSGTTPMNPAVLVLTPAMGLTAEGTSSTYTPGARYSGM